MSYRLIVPAVKQPKEALSNQSPVSARPVAERTMLQICLNSLRSC